MGVPLASQDDVAEMWRPIADAEVMRVDGLIRKASALLRQLMPNIDARIALSDTAPAAREALDPSLVASVVATAVKDYLANSLGAASETETVGPYSHSVSYVLRGEKGPPRGVLGYSPALLDLLQPTYPASELYAPVRVKPALASWPLGRYGGPNPYGSDYPDRVVPTYYGSDPLPQPVPVPDSGGGSGSQYSSKVGTAQVGTTARVA